MKIELASCNLGESIEGAGLTEAGLMFNRTDYLSIYPSISIYFFTHACIYVKTFNISMHICMYILCIHVQTIFYHHLFSIKNLNLRADLS